MESMSNSTTPTTTFAAAWDAPGSDRGFFRLAYGDPTRIETVGSDLGGKVTIQTSRNTPGIGLVQQWHVEGGSHWSGRGMARGTHGAQVFTVLVERKDATTWRYVKLASHEIARNAEERGARNATHVANVLRTMEVPS